MDSDSAISRKITLHHTKTFTVLAFHPMERMVTAGDVTGRILIWRGFGAQKFLESSGLVNEGSSARKMFDKIFDRNLIFLVRDTIVRFSPYSEILREGLFADFAHVADDESLHFSWCAQRLAELVFKYGDIPVHNFLWRECEKSSDNVAPRLAVIPLVQEARGLAAGPLLVQKKKKN